MQSTNIRQGKRGDLGSNISGKHPGLLPNGICGHHQEEKRADPGAHPWMGRWYPVESVRIEWMGAGRQLLS